MSISSNVPVPTPPPRRITPTVVINDDTSASRTHNDRRMVRAYFAGLTANQAAVLSRVLKQIPTIVKEIRDELLTKSRQEMKAGFRLSTSVIQSLNAQAWEHERWHEEVLKVIPCIGFEEATSRCESGPWDLRSDLLVLPHGGRLYVPAFQFDSAGTPSAIWITLVAALRNDPRQPTDWDVLRWILKPHPLLDQRTPWNVLSSDPQRVRQLAESLNCEEYV